jgi:hypothetical protein
MRTETKTINIYSFDELSVEAKENVVYWLDFNPIEYETESGEMECQYFIDMEESEIKEHCDMNGYEFLECGAIY